ncbi:MAG TPA: heparan-alpha-glucosaminide N-acetyltransferase domain-containing protein, partial [Mucilaginibacter sp.]
MASAVKDRIESLDLLKGLVIVIMAIDHTRDYFHFSNFYFDPTDPLRTTIPIFFTRFITNFCAPAFCFLAGLSAFLVGRRKSPRELSAFLLKRGLWLIFVEVVLINFGWHFDLHVHDIAFQVIWVLGISMVILAALIHLPRKYLFILSCAVIFGHNLLDPVHFNGNMLWAFIHDRHRFKFTPGLSIGVGYPIIPWFAVMSLGYCFGSFYDKSYDPAKRKKLFNT